MTTQSREKAFALNWIEQNRQRLSDFDLEIWRYAEPAWREYKSAQAYRELLRSEGFAVEERSGGMDTAFMATWGGGGGPTIGGYAEYDAVPGNSQQVVTHRAPREGLHPWAAGHTDPHSMLGTAGLTGMLAAKATMEHFGIKGALRFFGEPAEKVCGSKPVHAAKGYYDGVDAFIAYHPHPSNSVAWETQCGSYWSAVFTFECVTPELWGAASPGTHSSHTTARCPGAIDAVCLMYTTTKYTKESMFPHTGTWTLNEFIMAAGDATADNLPPRFGQIQYSWRAPTLAIQEQILAVLERNAKHVAAMTGCEVSIRWVTRTRVGLTNNALADLAYRNMELIGPPTYDEATKEFGRALQSEVGVDPMDNPFMAEHDTLLPPQEYEARTRALLPSWQLNFTSDDYVEYTWHAPTVRIFTARARLRAPQAGYTYPAWTYNALGGLAGAIDPGMFLAGKTIAGTILDLLTQPDELARCKAEFDLRTGGGIGGSTWVAPLLPRDFVAPTDLRWPEYITTPRGDEWWVPTPVPGTAQRL